LHGLDHRLTYSFCSVPNAEPGPGSTGLSLQHHKFPWHYSVQLLPSVGAVPATQTCWCYAYYCPIIVWIQLHVFGC